MNEKLLERLLMIAVVLGSLLVMSPSIADPDLWGHVQYGRDWIHDGQLATTNTYSYSAEGYRWINHENLSELAMAVAVDRFGAGGLIFLRALLAIFVISCVLGFNIRSGHSLLVSGIITLLVAWNLGFHFSYRPQVATIVGFTSLMLVLQIAFSGWRDRWHVPAPKFLSRWLGTADDHLGDDHDVNYDSQRGRILWLVPVILCVWTNSHGGFLAGLLILVAYLGLRTVEAMIVRRGQGWGLLRRMGLMMMAAIASTLVNPYSLDLIQWMVYSVGNARPEISDWSSAELFSITGMKFWILLGFTVFSLALSRRPKDFTQLVIWALIVWQSLSHFRHIQFFSILCGFWLAPHLESALLRLGQTPQEKIAGETRPPVWQFAIAFAGLAGLAMALVPRLTEIRVDRTKYPVNAIQFMAENGLTGRTVVTFDWAQYFIGAMCSRDSVTGPLSSVGFDGRFRTCYPQEIIDTHFDFLFGEGAGVPRNRSKNSPPCDPTRVLRVGSPDLVLNRRFNERTSLVMAGQSDNWSLLYEDPIAQVWGRRQVFDNPQDSRYMPFELRRTSGVQLAGYEAWPAFPLLATKQRLQLTSMNGSIQNAGQQTVTDQQQAQPRIGNRAN